MRQLSLIVFSILLTSCKYKQASDCDLVMKINNERMYEAFINL
jgi:hypothetical protein